MSLPADGAASAMAGNPHPDHFGFVDASTSHVVDTSPDDTATSPVTVPAVQFGQRRSPEGFAKTKTCTLPRCGWHCN